MLMRSSSMYANYLRSCLPPRWALAKPLRVVWAPRSEECCAALIECDDLPALADLGSSWSNCDYAALICCEVTFSSAAGTMLSSSRLKKLFIRLD